MLQGRHLGLGSGPGLSAPIAQMCPCLRCICGSRASTHTGPPGRLFLSALQPTSSGPQPLEEEKEALRRAIQKELKIKEGMENLRRVATDRRHLGHVQQLLRASNRRLEQLHGQLRDLHARIPLPAPVPGPAGEWGIGLLLSSFHSPCCLPRSMGWSGQDSAGPREQAGPRASPSPCSRACVLGTLALGRAAEGPAPGSPAEAAAGGTEGEARGGEYDTHMRQWHPKGEGPLAWSPPRG